MQVTAVDILGHYREVLEKLMRTKIESDVTVVTRSHIDNVYVDTAKGIQERRIRSITELKDDEKAAIEFLSPEDFLNSKVYIAKASIDSFTDTHIHTEHEEYTVLKGRVIERENSKLLTEGQSLFVPMLTKHSLYFPTNSLMLIKIKYATQSL